MIYSSKNRLSGRFRKYWTSKESGNLQLLSGISGMVLWLRGDSLSTTDGVNVTTWLDESGKSNHFTNVTGTPIVKTNIINGKSVCRFSGGQILRSTSNVLLSKTTLTCFIVLAPRGSVWNIVLEQGLSAFSFERVSNLIGKFYVGDTGGGETVTSVLEEFEIRTLKTVSGINLITARNGVEGSPVSFSDNTGTGQLFLGGRSGGTYMSNCDIAEVVIYDRELTTDEYNYVKSQLSTKYSITTI